jgi:hypothetical protein
MVMTRINTGPGFKFESRDSPASTVNRPHAGRPGGRGMILLVCKHFDTIRLVLRPIYLYKFHWVLDFLSVGGKKPPEFGADLLPLNLHNSYLLLVTS